MSVAQQQPSDRSVSVRVLGIAGSLRAGSYNRRLLGAAGELLPAGLELDQWTGLKAIPPFDEDGEEVPAAAVVALRQAIAAADAVLIATPEYNSSLPGQLKNALDWASRPYATNVLRGKPVAVVGASPSPSGARSAQADLRRILARTGAHVIDRELPVAAAYKRFSPDGRLSDHDLRSRLAEILAQVASEARSPALAAA